MDKRPKIILNIATHGDEKIGLKVATAIKKLNLKKGEVIVNIANERAFKLNKRFIHQDLNRSFPGKKTGNYEEKRAYKLLPIIKSADIVIDIHSTTSELTDSLIVTKDNETTRKYIKIIAPKYALIMKATKNNALISNAKVGLAFEYGKDRDTKVLRKIVVGIKRLLIHLNMLEPYSKKRLYSKTTFFIIYTTIPKPKGAMLIGSIKNYKLIRANQVYAKVKNVEIKADKNFYPILFGNKNYEEIFGFGASKIA